LPAGRQLLRASLPLGVLLLHALLIQPIVFLLLHIRHIFNASLRAPAPLNTPSSVVEFEALLTWRLAWLLHGLVHMGTVGVGVC
jgi:hypothetical protein